MIGGDKEYTIFKAEVKEIIRDIVQNRDIESDMDLIITTDGKAIECDIVSITSELVEYRTYNDKGIKMEVIPRNFVSEVIKRSSFEEEKVLKRKKETKPHLKSFSELSDAHRNNIKTSFTGFGNGSIVLGYERALNLRLRAEVLFHAHGAGLMPSNEVKTGLGAELGIKFKLKAPQVDEELYDNHYLEGSYFKFGFGIGSVNEQIENPNNSFIKFENVNRDYYHAGVDLGYQWVFVNRITMDVFMGVGYFGGSFEKTVNENGVLRTEEVIEVEDGDLYGDNNLVLSTGLRIGYLFSLKK